MIQTRFFTYIIFFCFLFLEVKSNNTSIFHKYSSENGLSDNFVTSITEDYKGFIWITTNYGINRFDGENFKIYTINEYPSLLRNDFTSSVTDKDGNVFFSSYNGVVVRYNQKTHSFENKSITTIFGSDFVSIMSLYKDADSCIYAVTTSGIFTFNYNTDSFQDDSTCINTRTLRSKSLYIDKNKRLWIGANTGLHVFNNIGKEIAHFDFSKSANDENICLHSYNDSILLIGTVNNGLWSVKTNDSLQHITSPVQIHTPFNDVNTFFDVTDHRLLIGTLSKGLWYIDNTLPEIDLHSFKPLEKDSKAITCIYEDNNKNIWSGTRGTGILCIQKLNKSKVIHSSEYNFPSTIVSSFGKDNTGNLWVGSDGDGIFVLSPNYKIKSILNEQNKLSSNGVLGIAHDSENSFWIATWGGGICRINEKTLESRYWTTWNSDIPLNNSKSICVSNSNTVWVATHGEGLTWYDENKNNWQSYKNGAPESYYFAPENWLNQVIEGQNGEKWIATIHSIWYVNGENVKKVLSDTINKPMHLPLWVHSITLTTEGNVMAATNRGIYKINAESMLVESLQCLSTEEIISIAVDKKNRCWATSNNHIFEIDSKAQTANTISISNHTISANYFIPRAIYIDSSNNIYLGAVDGFLIFNPDSLGQNNIIQTLEFENIYISSKRIDPKDHFLSKDTYHSSTLTLPYNMANNIRIDYNIVCTDNTHSAYMIEGLDNEWISLGKERSIVLNKLSTGKYTLKLRGIVDNNREVQKTISLQIIITPPWWETWWFIVFCIIVLVLIVMIAIKIRFRQIIHYNERLEIEVSTRTQELKLAYDEITLKNDALNEKQSMIENKNKELAQSISTKDQLMSIIAHDLKNPAFSIVSLLELIKRNFDRYDDIKKNKLIAVAHNSAITLQNELLKMLEWGTIQQKAFTFNPQNTNIKNIIIDVISFLQQTASDKSIEIRLNTEKDFIVFIDSQMISIALRNLLNNAIKYTPRGGIIYISCSQDNEVLSISLKDTGVGMSKKQLQNLFDSDEYISTRGTENEKGTGLGLKIVKEFIEKNNGQVSVTSELKKGTCFTIKLPMLPGYDNSPDIDTEKRNEVKKELIKINYNLFEGSFILIIDDNPGIREHLRSILERHCSVLEAENGEEGFLIAKQNQPDIIVSDVDMPNMDGFSLSKKIQSTPSTSHIPLILLTAKTENIDKINGLLSGAIDYITKPFKEEELLIKLSNLLQIKQNIQKNVLIERLNGDDVKTKIDPFLDKFISEIENHYKDPEFNVEKLADQMAISRSTLIRRSKVLIDKTPSDVIVEYRLETAKKMIDSGSKNISEIAYDTGFSDPRYFTRRFKQYYGKTPSEYMETK